LAGYLEEVASVRRTLDSRYDDLESGRVKPIDGEEAFRKLREKSERLHPASDVLDESRHFFFYYRQAEIRLERPAVARVTRLLVDRFWAPVGSGVQPRDELCFLGAYLFGGAEGRAAARKVDDTIRRLPGFATVRLLDAWMDRFVEMSPGSKGKSYGDR